MLEKEMSYLDISTFFTNSAERNLVSLQEIYRQSALLKDRIRALFSTHLPAEDIRNKRVLLKPNLVKQDLCEHDAMCLRTHESVILACVEVLLDYSPQAILIGDAPIQGCNWELMSEKLQAGIDSLKGHTKIPIHLIDFRRVSFDTVANTVTKERRPWSDYVLFDLQDNSYLEPVCNDRRKPFRILQYNRDRLAMSHHSGKHCYCIAREFLECDTVIVMPKIKTHEKVCFTNALKIIVGVNGDKDFLPHHRIGGTSLGGDCYKGGNFLRRFSEWLFDMANYTIGHWPYKPLYYAGRLLWKLTFPGTEHPFTAGWYGNDTTWRMVMDLNTIACYGTKEGKIASSPQRRYYVLCDGIVAGQGNGPLRPEPFPLGILAFSDNPFLTDSVIGKLCGLNPDFIPLLKQATLKAGDLHEHQLTLNGNLVSFEKLCKLTVQVKVPVGWTNYKQAK